LRITALKKEMILMPGGDRTGPEGKGPATGRGEKGIGSAPRGRGNGRGSGQGRRR